jgi:hypothetical protein
MMMRKFSNLFSLVRDAVAVLGTDRAVPSKRDASQKAIGSLRNSYYWSRAKVPATGIAQVVAKLTGGKEVPPVILPPPSEQYSEVGNAAYHYAIACVVRAVAPERILEIGTFKGVTTYLMLLNTDRCQIVTVDLPLETTAESQLHLNDGDRRLVRIGRQSVGAAFSGKPGSERIRQVLQDSTKLNVREHLPSADLVFVDGGHTYDLVKNDTEKAFEILSERGTVLWDDYGCWHPGVPRYLDELSEKMTLFRIEETGLVIGSRQW